MMTPPLVMAVVLNWNSLEATRTCLRGLAATDYPNLSVIVVDNASTDGSADALSQIETITLIRNRVNLGFTGGVNAGLRRAMDLGADYVWLLNSDATVGPELPGKLVNAAESDPRLGLVSPVFHDPCPPHAAEVCLARFDPVSGIASQTDDPTVARQWRDRHAEQIVLFGTALLVRRSLIERIGELDDRFFAYVEDVDYSLRSTAAGFHNVSVPDAIAYHAFKRPVQYPTGVPGYLHYYMSRNYLLLWRKLPGRLMFSRALLWFLRERLRQISRMRHDLAAVDAVVTGIWDGLLGRGGRYDPRQRTPSTALLLLARYSVAPGWLAAARGIKNNTGAD